MKLAVKLALGLMLATALVFAVFAWQLRSAERRSAEQLVNANAESLSDIIRRGTRYQMLRNDRDALYRMIRDIGSEPGIRRIRILSKTGQISFSTSDAETSRVVDKSAEACYGCHAQAAPLEKLNRADRARVFDGPGGQRILGVILPIENEPDCWSAACHVHSEKQKVLGVIDVQVSLASADSAIAAQQSMVARFTAAATAILGLLTLAFIWAMVYRPLRRLTKGIRQVTRGDLDHPIPIGSRDELGEVAADFNRMTDELSAARKEITAWTHTLEDRVESKTRELEQAHHSLLHSEKLASIGKLAATVAHEINNPLFGILTNARLARKQVQQQAAAAGAPAEKLSSRLDVIERESQRCGEIVKNLLMFSRQARPQMEAVSLETVMDRAVALIDHSYRLQNIALNVQPGHNGATVRGDAGQLQQVLLVLLTNAAEAMPQGGAVTVSTSVHDKEVHIHVRDNGPGVPEELRERIFEPFFTTKEDGHRTGLGLAVAYGIVEQHRGALELLPPSPGGGTEFRIRLPLAPAPHPVLPQAQAVAP